MTQPNWKFIANLGDANPIDYGGLFVFEDTTGVYPAEAEYLECPESDDRNESYHVYRFSLPITLDSWINTAGIAAFVGIDEDSFISNATNADSKIRAIAYGDIGSYHGFYNLDSYPLVLTRAEVCKRYVWYQAYRRLHHA